MLVHFNHFNHCNLFCSGMITPGFVCTLRICRDSFIWVISAVLDSCNGVSSRHEAPRDFVGYLQKYSKLAFRLFISAKEDKAARFYYQEHFQPCFAEEAKLRREPFTRPEAWGLGRTMKSASLRFCLPDGLTGDPNAACVPLENDNGPTTLASRRALWPRMMACSDNSAWTRTGHGWFTREPSLARPQGSPGWAWPWRLTREPRAECMVVAWNQLFVHLR